MVDTCFYFQVHQPVRMRNYSVFDINHDHDYFDHKKNAEIARKVAQKCYLPANRLMLDLINEHDGRFKISYSVTGVALDQFEEYTPEVIDSFRALAKTGCVEFLGETYHHSLSFLYSKREFEEQVALHDKKMRQLFGARPQIFRNTELIYNNELAMHVEKMGYKGILAEGADHILGWRSPNFLYKPVGTQNIKLMLKNYRLSDDIAFRFSEKSWKEHPLTVEKFTDWVNAINGNGNVLNLFMDYETFGEHQWASTGIFRFLRALPGSVLQHPDNGFVTPSEAAGKYDAMAELDIHHPISWADVERDLSAWKGNRMQDEALAALYAMEEQVKASNDPAILKDWRRMTTSDHFYYMCTKWFADGDVHKYFNPYDSPYDSFIIFFNALNDLTNRINAAKAARPEQVSARIEA